MLKRLRKKLLSFFIVFVLTLTSCVKAPSVQTRIVPAGTAAVNVNVYIANAFTDAERANIINGILLWQRATNGLMQWKLVSYDEKQQIPPAKGLVNGVEERTVVFQRAKSSDEWVVKYDKDHSTKDKEIWVLGICQGSGLKDVAQVWLVENRLTNDIMEVITAAHEFGHAIGLNHIDDKKSTMSSRPTDNKNICVTPHDLREFCDKHNCVPEGLAVACKL